MKTTIHKANYKNKVQHYSGFGQYELIPTTVCRGGKGYWSKRPPRGGLARNWKDVTCKNCLRHSPASDCSPPPFVGKRVRIKEGAWSGESGTITGDLLANNAYPIRTDGGICLAWYRHEFDFEENVIADTQPE